MVDIKNLSLSFKLSYFKSSSFREVFVAFFMSPLQLFRQGKRLILFEDLNLQIGEGDIVAFVGTNGSGKTTLCRIIAGILSPQKGSVSITGDVRAIFDTSVSIQPELTGYENAILLIEFLYPGETSENKAKILEESMKFTDLADFIDTPVKFYSAGMHARLCLSLVSAKEGDVLILDEVFEGADQFFTEKISARIENLIQKSGAVIFVSHSFHQIKRVCNRAIVLKKGRIVFDGHPADAEKIYVRDNS